MGYDKDDSYLEALPWPKRITCSFCKSDSSNMEKLSDDTYGCYGFECREKRRRQQL